MKTKKFLGGLALGALLGGAMGLFFSPDNGKKNRDLFKKVSKQISEALVKELANLKTFGKKEYEEVVENIVNKYSKDDLLKPEVWQEIVKELKLRYKDIQREVKKAKTRTTKTASKVKKVTAPKKKK